MGLLFLGHIFGAASANNISLSSFALGLIRAAPSIMLQPLTATMSCSSLSAHTLSSVIRGRAGIAVNTIYSRGHLIFKGSSPSFARFGSVLFCEQSHLSVKDFSMVGSSCAGLLFSFGYNHRTNIVFNWVLYIGLKKSKSYCLFMVYYTN